MMNENTFILLTLVFTAIFCVLIHFGLANHCTQQTVSFEDSKYQFFGGCMVEHNGRWVPLKNVRFEGDKVIYE